MQETKDYYIEEKLLYYLLIISPLIYLLILFILNAKIIPLEKYYMSIFSNNFLSLLLYLLICVSIISIILTYAFLIPFSRKEKGLAFPPGVNAIILTIGAVEIALNGLIFGIIFWNKFNFIPFHFVIPFIGFGFIHGIYLYYKYIIKGKENLFLTEVKT